MTIMKMPGLLMSRKIRSSLGLLAIIASPSFLATASFAEPAEWEIDAEHFSIAFEAGHIGFQQQLGFFLEASGSFSYDSETQQLGAGRVESNAESELKVGNPI